MKPKHLEIRIEQCLSLAKASNCTRRKFGALLLDPKRNVVLVDGYNGGPRGGADLCGEDFCFREGLKPEDITFGESWDGRSSGCTFLVKGKILGHHSVDFAQQRKPKMLAMYPPIESGTRVEIGCVHAEMNVICNAAAGGVKSAGAWLFVTGEPCLQCAKLIHHAGIVHVVVVAGGYLGANGIEYLNRHKVKVTYVDGPQDPRLQEKFGGST